MPAIALISDLLLQSQLAGASARSGAAVTFAGSIEALLDQVEGVQPRLVILDLGNASLEVAQLLPTLKSLAPQATILAFGPHVHRQRLQAAADAGCDVVMSRGAFHADMDGVLTRFAG